MRWAASDVSPPSHLAFHIPTLAGFCLLFVWWFLFVCFVALLCFCFLFCKCLGIPNSPRSLDLDDRQGLIARSAMQQKKKKLRVGRGNHPKIFGSTYDLRSAYKQFPISARDRDLLRIAVNRPGANSPSIFGVNALPFGAVGSVAGFLRISHALWFIGTVGLGLCWTAFYDDFSVLTSVDLYR